MMMENRLRPGWLPDSCEDARTHQDHQGRAILSIIMVPEAATRYIEPNIRGHVPVFDGGLMDEARGGQHAQVEDPSSSRDEDRGTYKS